MQVVATRVTRVKTMDDYAGELAGFQARMPRSDGGMLDAAMVEEWPCFQCGGPQEYRPYVRYDKDGDLVAYRAFAVCLKCSAAAEF